ncbi:hypothetical protein WJX72_001547 [[Myrmecia] bisecta]|uniref:E3 ubiquitin-protein ligase listerin n=1 Tax=[Myrmecia] bisecta TaxID=41462 RepID=A0AAW1Q1I6_9CHLO
MGSRSRVDLAAALCEAFGCPVVLDNLAASQSDNRVWLAVEVLCRCEEDEGLEGTARLLRDWLAGAPAQAAPAQGGSLVVEVLQRLLEGAAHSGENAAVFVGALCKLLEVLADSPGPGLATAQHFFAQHVVPASAHGVVSGALLRALLDEVAPAFRDGGDADGIADAGLTELTGALVEAVLARPPVTVLEGATMAACDALCTLLHCFPIGDRLSSAGAATAEERSSLLAVLQRQVGGRQAATAAAAALRRMALQAGAGPDADPEDQHPRDSVEVDAAVAELALRVVAYCWPIMTHQDWGAVLALLQAGVTAAALILEQRAEAVVGAVVAAAARLSTAAPPLPDVALQLLQRLNRLGLTQGSDKYKEAEAGLVAELADEGSGEALSRVAQAWLRTLALLLEVGRQPASQLAASEAWQAARHSLLSDALRLLFAKGICEAAASAGGVVTSAASVAWRSACRPLWDAVAQTTIAAASSSSEQAAVAQGIAEADAWAAETGVDACGSLLALLLTDQPHPGLQSAALKMLLGPDLVTRLSTAAVLVAKEEAEEAVGGGGDAVTLLTDAGVRVEVAAAVMHSQGTRSFLLAWAVLLAHLLAFAPGAPGCRHLAETIRGIHELVPTLLDMLSGHLPLAQQPTPPSGKRPIASKPGHSAAAAAAAAEDRRTIDWDFAADLQALGVPQCAADLPPLARLLYRAVLHALPSSARSWFMDLRDRSLAAAVEAYTAEHESPALLRREFALLQSPVAGSQDNFSIRTNPVTREVVSVMDVEDGARLEMVVRLPAAAPLRPPEVDCRRKVGVAEGRLRKWLLSITAFLRNQNGSVAEAIALWQRNVGKEFEGVEECLICYSVVSATDGKLPRLQCNTCSKKFHGACLYKWFKSSGKSNCPHCQSPW